MPPTLLFLVTLGVPTPLAAFDDVVARGARFQPRTVLLAVEEAMSEATLSAHAEALGCDPPRRLAPRRPYFVVQCGARTRDLLATWAQLESVTWVEANFAGDVEGVPNDLDETQWYHDNFGQIVYPTNATYRLEGIREADIGSVEAWDLTVGSPDVVMAVVDSGVDTEHPELAGRIWTNPKEDCTNGIDDDANGYVDDCHGWDTADDDADPSVRELPDRPECARDHGTSVAGVMAANGDNGIDVAGVNWGSQLMPLKTAKTSTTHGCDYFVADTIEAMFYALDNGADVINVSLSYPSSSSVLWEAFAREAAASRTVVVTSAGNGGTTIEAYDRQPPLLDLDTMLVVANTTNRDELWAGVDRPSNYGAGVAIAAPGYVIRTIKPEPLREVARSLGTSFSAPLVAGVVGLVRSYVPELSAEDTIRAVLEGADVVPGLECGASTRCVDGGRRLDAHGALLRAVELADLDLAIQVLGASPISGDGVVTVDFEAMSTGTMALRGLQAELTLDEASGFEVVRERTSLGDLAPGETANADALSATFLVRVPDGCVGPTALPIGVTVDDERGRTWTVDEVVEIACDEAPDPVVADAGGCACSSRSSPRRSLWTLLLVAFVWRRGSKR